MQFLFAFYLAHSGEQHAVGLLPHHLARRQIENRYDGLTDELLGLVEFVDSGQDLPGCAAAVIKHELQQLIALLYSLAGEDLAHAHVALCELIDRHVGQHRLGSGRFGAV